MARMRKICLAALAVLALMCMTNSVVAGPDLSQTLSGKKFSIKNVFTVDGQVTCPGVDPNTVAFHPSSGNPYQGTVTIVGNFDAANIGVCKVPPGNQYAVDPSTTINYYIYENWVVWRIAGRTATATKFVFQQNKLSAVGVANSGTYYVSDLTNIGKAY